MLLEKAREHADEIRGAGAEAAKLALAAGVPVYYFDDSLGDGIIKEMPDGNRFRIAVTGGKAVVTEALPPKP
ncbi:MAG TPA: hypothetical protein VGC77_14895 [Rhodopseudomonas sp.]|uniref:hypothetical protein n=1 Tax=Rhodopseudomonas sp. TaxID=1078 RepID=UPI002ED8C8B3